MIQEEILKCDHSRESKSGGSTFEYGDGIIWCDQSNESVAKCRRSWVVGRGRGSWVSVWVNVVGKKVWQK